MPSSAASECSEGSVFLVPSGADDGQLAVPELSRGASAQARSSPSQFLYGHSEDTNSTNGLVTPCGATWARAASASPGLNRSWSTAS